MILGLFSEALTAGGIQRVALHTATALDTIARETNRGAQFLSLNDAVGDHEQAVDGRSIRIRGYGTSKAAFARGALASSGGVTDVYVNHVGLVPVGAAVRFAHPSSRLWIHLHGVEAWSPLPLSRRTLLRVATGFLSISNYTAERAVESQGIQRERIRLLPNALDPSFLRRAEAGRHDRAHTPRRLLTVGRLAASERYKGVDAVIRALPIVLRENADVVFDVIGDGDDRPRLEALARECRVDEAVRFRGRVADADLVDAYRSADLFVMPSRGEGLGVVYLEAMAFGLPVIAGRYGGAPEVVIDGKTGFLVSQDDTGELATSISTLLRDTVLARRMGEAGRARVHEEFSYEHFVRRLRGALLGERRS